MKIGIMTFHRANNLGAVLQASALLNYMQDHFGDCELIDFYPNNSIPAHNGVVRKILHLGKQALTFPTAIKVKKKEKRFEDYREKYYSFSDKSYYGDKGIGKNPPHYDLLISGSDQILNVTLTGKSTSYYLDFVSNAKKVSYASSFGREKVSEDEIELIKKEFPNFQGISVREQSAADIILRETGIKATLVVDPVFLLAADEWSSRCNSVMKLPDKYIFVYSMENSSILESTVKKLQETYKISVIVVRGGGQSGRIEGSEDPTCGPTEFLRYIRDAEIVITNSFHGIALSIIFGKKIISVAHSCRNTRLENITRMIDKREALIATHDMANHSEKYIIDGIFARDKMKEYIEQSKRYLDISIRNMDR